MDSFGVSKNVSISENDNSNLFFQNKKKACRLFTNGQALIRSQALCWALMISQMHLLDNTGFYILVCKHYTITNDDTKILVTMIIYHSVWT